MATFKPGLVHTPVTPFTGDEKIDFDQYKKLIEFHIRNGAQSLALPMHPGESVSLSDAERRQLLEFALKQVNGRVPVIAHASQSGTGVAAALATHAIKAGAAAVVAAAHYWTPPPAMLLEHFTQIGKATPGPFFIYNSPDEMGGVEVKTDLVMKLLERLDNFQGVIDASMDWQFMIEVVSTAQRSRPEFQLLIGNEYLISGGAIGATGMFAPMAGIAPRAVRELWDLCVKEQYPKARPVQEALAALRQVVKKTGVSGLKGAMAVMGRDCGIPRPPLDPLDKTEHYDIAGGITAISMLNTEPRGW